MLATPTTTQIANALHVVQSPELFANTPSLRAMAWGTLMSQRGHRVNQIRIAQMQRAQRVTEGVQAHIAKALEGFCTPIQQQGA